ncbi:MAG: hypothetical protein JW819_08705 [Candidatus Krumholzibacteriota bacterium]|nr:hypothetical protein [Candidatus Krumholzibacteriota bacterium]
MAGLSLTYYIAEGILTGNLAGKRVRFRCTSGGGGGKHPKHKDKKSKEYPTEQEIIDNPLMTKRLRVYGKQRGGPLPVGLYRIKKPFGAGGNRKAKLVPLLEKGSEFTKRTGREGGFEIHGRGFKGSDGCIVPQKPKELHMLMDALTLRGGGSLLVLKSKQGSISC